VQITPAQSRLEITMATAAIDDFPKPDMHIFDRGYVLKTETGNHSNYWYGYGTDANGRIEEVYKTGKPLAKTVQINGHYTFDEEASTISQKIDLKNTDQ
jgi:hypothetical protein